MRVAIEGCAHGELEKIYETIAFIEQEQNFKVDLLLCCGDFQSTRNLNDLECMSVPKKFRDICTFHKYYSGEKVAPILTIFIGGNHEASNYLQELPYGGWVAPNIYYLGYAGVVKYKGIRIGGLSGIYKGFDYFKGHFEKSPYDTNAIRSVYHYRQQETFRLQQLAEPIDMLMSHDWPNEIYNYGNTGQLIRFKPHFRDEIHNNTLGSPPCFELLKKLKPTAAAVFPHEDGSSTKFLALDKCLPNRRFLQIVDIETSEDASDKLQYDLEWLTILYTTKHLTHVKPFTNYMPGPGNTTSGFDFRPTEEEKNHVLNRFGGNLDIPNNFERTAPPYDPNNRLPKTFQPKPVKNPQTVNFCNLLDIDDPLNLIMILSGGELNCSEYRDVANASISDNSLVLNESDRLDDLSENNTLNISTASSGGVSNLTMLNQRLSLFDSLPAPKIIPNESLNPEEANIDSSDDDTPNADDVSPSNASPSNVSPSNASPRNISPSNVSPSLRLDDIPEDISEAVIEPKSTSPEPFSFSPITEKRAQFDEMQTESTPIIKKFKRRNAAIYNADSDE